MLFKNFNYNEVIYLIIYKFKIIEQTVDVLLEIT